MSKHWIFSVVMLLGAVLVALAQQSPPTPGSPGAAGGKSSDLVLVERLVVLRKDYQRTLEQLRFYYLQANDQERAKMAEDELVNWHRIRKHAFIEDLEVPPPTLQGNVNVTEANDLITRALNVKDKGWGTDYIDNQRRAEILLQEVLTKYPHCNHISVAAYNLADIYESKANQMFRRAAWYYTRSFQWQNSNFQDARLRAARLYDHKLNDRTRALELYRDVTTKDPIPAHQVEARKRIEELSGNRK